MPEGTEIGIPELDSQPQTDVVRAVAKIYQKAHLWRRDVHLGIEVAESSYAEIYAQAGIKDPWVGPFFLYPRFSTNYSHE
jgi:hypothetical protein